MTAREIAKLTGFSRSTVQRALSNDPNIADDTKAKILVTSKELGYSRNKPARALILQKKKVSYAVVLGPEQNPFYTYITKGIRKAIDELKDYKINSEIHYNNQIDEQQQANTIIQLIEKKVNGIVFIPIESKVVSDAVKYGIDKGVKFIAIATRLKDVEVTSYIGQDNYKSGLTAGSLMRLVLPDGGKIACVVGSKKYSAHNRRLKGFRDKWLEGDNADIEVFENRENSDESYKIVNEILNSSKNIKGFFIAGAGVTGLCRALELSKKSTDYKVICYDLLPPYIDYCNKGVIDFMIDQQAFKQGYQSLMLLNNAVLYNEVLASNYYSPINIYIKDNIQLSSYYTPDTKFL